MQPLVFVTAQAIINGQVASVAFFISSKGKQYPGVSLLQLTDLLSMNLKVRLRRAFY